MIWNRTNGLKAIIVKKRLQTFFNNVPSTFLPFFTLKTFTLQIVQCTMQIVNIHYLHNADIYSFGMLQVYIIAWTYTFR